MATCQAGELEWAYSVDSTGLGWSSSGSTPQQACSQIGDGVGGSWSISGGLCVIEVGGNTYHESIVENCSPDGDDGDPPEGSGVIQCGQACTVEIAFATQPLTSEKTADALAIFALFIGPLIAVWAARWLLGLFSGDTERS